MTQENTRVLLPANFQADRAESGSKAPPRRTSTAPVAQPAAGDPGPKGWRVAWKTSFGVRPDVSSETHIGPGSSNGRTSRSEREGRGSSPCPGTIGPVAQEEERFSDTEEAAGSTPALPTCFNSGE